MPVSPVATLTLLVLLAAAAVADARTRRIPNRLTLAGILLGLLLAITGGGPAAFASALAGSGAAFAAFFVLYALGGMGAGDVKLVAAAGAFLGVPLRTYVLGTLVGIIPGSFVFASVGAGLGSVLDSGQEFSPASVLTPQIVIALVTSRSPVALVVRVTL